MCGRDEDQRPAGDAEVKRTGQGGGAEGGAKFLVHGAIGGPEFARRVKKSRSWRVQRETWEEMNSGARVFGSQGVV